MSIAHEVLETRTGSAWRVSGAWTVPLRLLLGLLWFTAALPKLKPPFTGTAKFIKMMAEGNPAFPGGNPIEPFRRFLEAVVIPHAQLFGFLVAFGELAVGISLLLGLMTRFGALVGIFLLINYWLGSGYMSWGWKFPILIAPHVLLIAGCAGRYFGLDAWLARKWPRLPIW